MNRTVFSSGAFMVMGAAGLAAMTLLFFLVFGHSQASYLHNGVVNFAEATGYWKSELAAHDVEYARSELVKTGDAMPIEQSHTLAHAFGQALFEKYGPSAFGLCPDNFLKGCEHQFVGADLSAQGLAGVSDVAKSCYAQGSEAPSCFHSLGHGLVGYFGYDTGALKKALALCAPFEDTPRTGCAEGAVMEYLLRFVAGIGPDGQLSPRPFDEAERYDPCPSLAERDRSSCYFELPLWWWWDRADVKGTQLSAFFATMGHYCAGLSILNERRACFEGIGHDASISGDLQQEPSFRLCTAAATDPRDRLFCITGVLGRFALWNVPGTVAMCAQAGFSKEYEAYCVAHVRAGFGREDSIQIPAQP